MVNLNRMFSRRSMKILMVIVLFALIVAAIWFLGPLLGFGETRPLEGMEARIIFICLALLCLTGLWFNVPIFVLMAATACVVVWVIGPYILIGNGYPLGNITNRLTLIGIILFFTLLYGIWKLLLALKNNPRLLDTLFGSKEAKPDDDASEVNATIRDAAAYIRKIRKNASFIRRFFLPGKPDGELPWYLVIGTAGAGKTTAILSSGQYFPLPEQLNRVCKESTPTRNCECWFANEALFIDTAGKYVEQAHSHLPEWNGILKAIGKYRAIQPINGAIVTLSMTDIMGRGKTELYDLSAKIRARLDDIRKMLGVRFPVYVLITRLDQLSGFAEYFRSLTEQEREQLWGVTFPYGEEIKTAHGDLHERVETELLLLEKRLERYMTVRQQEEYDNADRKRMYALPQDFRMLLEGVTEVMKNTFLASRYDENQGYTSLRGIYFVSSHQPEEVVMVNNSTLVQKWRNFIGNHHPAAQACPATLQQQDNALVTDVSWGRQYFLKQLFSEIILKDVDLVRHNLRVESKYRFQNFFGHALCIGVSVLLLKGFYQSYHNNGDYLHAVETRLLTLEGEVKTYQKNANPNRLPLLLNMAQYLPEFRGLDVLHPELAFRYGLYTGKELARNADGLYHYFLRRILFPLIESQALTTLRNAVYGRDNSDIYNSLKIYLMLSGQGKLNQQYLTGEIAKSWDSAGKLQPYEERSLFIAHLNTLFGLADWRQYGQPLDKELVEEARYLLGRKQIGSRLYERVMSQLQTEAPENLTLGKMTDEEAGQIFTVIDPELAEKGISGLFTYEGYHQVFKKKLGEMVRALQAEDRWIMGDPQPLKTIGIDREAGFVDPVRDALMKLYLKDYTRRWQAFLQNIRLKTEGLDNNNVGLSFDIYMMRTLVSVNSPLINLARRAVRETTLAEDRPEGLLKGQGLSGTGLANSQLLDAASKLNLALAAHEKKILRQGVDNYFLPLREFVGGGEMGTGAATGTKLHQVMGVLNDQYTLLVISDSAIKNGNQPAVSDAGQRLSAESAVWPDPFKYIIAPLLNGAYRRVNHQVVYSSNKTIAAGLGEICRNTLQGRYPFADNSEEVSMRDFERFFATGGLADNYFKKNLADKVDTSASPWRYRGDIDTQDSEALDVFERAEAIRAAFFQNNGTQLGINFSVAIPYMDPAITQLNLNFDGSSMTYTHGPVTPRLFHWPGNRAESVVNMSTKPRAIAQPNGMTLTGPWSLMRWLDTVEDIATSDTGQPILIFHLDKRNIKIEVSGLTSGEELIVDLLKNFHCPGAF
ncbi:type VI secretion system membrane subunit TssM [Erwinia phyllosphaerae]|uniref:type VI secretion system membrane subunit TssM n=1 Tax=Erwinia phyllosphaerae TaxID=2853256 RepID=UPI001FEE4255|nr:type VI secretion system membrane subunit TssM [Erwinia phyllosphaerae]MBV4367404.1 type VI secretion system membrane subunit TssM [Erwinia phyllosphaerae]